MVDIRGLDSSGSECRAVVGSVEHDNQPSDSTKVGKFLDQLRECQLPKKAFMETFLDFSKNAEILDLTATTCLQHQCLVNPNTSLETDPDLTSSFLTSTMHVLVSKFRCKIQHSGTRSAAE
jgi:hypothetical protein